MCGFAYQYITALGRMDFPAKKRGQRILCPYLINGWLCSVAQSKSYYGMLISLIARTVTAYRFRRYPSR